MNLVIEKNACRTIHDLTAEYEVHSRGHSHGHPVLVYNGDVTLYVDRPSTSNVYRVT